MSDDDDRHAWERPGAFEVSPGVFRIPLPLPQDGLRAVNVYAIVTGPRVTMIDAGWSLTESRERLESALASLGHDLGDVDRFLVTHAHRDHYTQAVAVRRLLGTHVAIGEQERPNFEFERSEVHFPAAILREMRENGAGSLADELVTLARAHASSSGDAPDLADWELPDSWIADGARIDLPGRVLSAVHTPGHTRGHLVFADAAAGVLFTGDHLLPHITPSIAFEGAPGDSPLTEYLASLELTLRMPDALMLPAHGPAGGRTHARAHALIEHHRDRLDEIGRAVAAGAATAFEVAEQVPWTSRKRALADLDLLSRILAVHETYAHLLVLAEQGRARATRADGGTRWAP